MPSMPTRDQIARNLMELTVSYDLLWARSHYDATREIYGWDFHHGYEAEAMGCKFKDGEYKKFNPVLLHKLFRTPFERERALPPREYWHSQCSKIDSVIGNVLYAWHLRPLSYERLLVLDAQQLATLVSHFQPRDEIFYHMIVQVLGAKDDTDNDFAFNFLTNLEGECCVPKLRLAVLLYFFLVRKPGTPNWNDFALVTETPRQWVAETPSNSKFRAKIDALRSECPQFFMMLYACELYNISCVALKRIYASMDPEARKLKIKEGEEERPSKKRKESDE